MGNKKKLSDRGSGIGAPSAPAMRGGALSRLLTAFRLRQAVLSGTADVPEGTAKHALNDHHDVGRWKHVGLLRTAVDGLFSAEYLTARGLDRRAATRHNDLVTQALDLVLTRWDQTAVLGHQLPSGSRLADDFVGLATGFAIELPLRLAAYEALYGHLHAFLPEIQSWLTGPKLKPWWASLAARAGCPLKEGLFYKHGELAARTICDIRDGKALPKEGTLPVLARRLAERAVRDRHEERAASSAELEFELRVAIAVAEEPGVARRLIGARTDDALTTWLAIFRHVLRGAPDAVVENLLQRGTESDAWPKVEQAAKEIWFARMLDWAQRIKANAARMMAEMPSNLPGVAREMAAADAAHVMFLSSIDPRPGADGPEKRMAELFANSRQLGLALANEAASPPEFRTELLAELRADALCMEAVAPWLGLSPQQQEERYRDAVAACDRSSYAHRSLGEHLLRAGKIEEAMRHLRRSVELNPENDEGRERLALVHGAREEHDEVLALTDRPTASPVLRATRAYTLLKTGDIGSAETLACEVLDGRPNDTLALRVLAACRRARGDVAKACELEMRADLFERGVRPPAG